MKKASLLLSLAIILNLGVMAQRSRVNIPAKDRKTLIEEASATSQTTQPTTTSKLLLSGYYMESFEGTFPPTGWSKLMPYTTNATGWKQCSNGTTPLYGMWAGIQSVPPMGGDKVAFCSYLTGYNDYMSCVNEPDTITTNGELRYVDLTTGNASLINQFMGGYGYANNITGFVILGSSWQDGLGVQNAINKGSHLEIYPNPAQENVYFVSSDQILNYKIITISGQVVINEKATDSAIAVNISEFKSGFYFVQIETEKGITTKKLNITR